MSQVPTNTGISYTIDVKGNLAEALGRLDASLGGLQSRLDSMLTTLQGAAGKSAQSSQKIAQATKDVASAQEKVNSTGKGHQSQVSSLTKAVLAAEAAERKLNSTLLQQAEIRKRLATQDFGRNVNAGVSQARGPQQFVTDAEISAERRYQRSLAATSASVREKNAETRRLILAERAHEQQVDAGTKATLAADAAERRATSTRAIDTEVRRRIAVQNFQKSVQAGVDLQGKSSGPGQFFKNILGIRDDDDKRVRGLLLSLQRLVAVVLVLKAIRVTLNFFDQTVSSAIKFNAELETANLGIATIITGAGQIRDITGQQVTGAQAFALAQKEAAKQTNQLRIDALNTIAPLNKIIEAFQTAIGPGLGAGLKIDEIRKFSVQISQAATAIGLEQGQLAEEIRSILQGTISTRQTRIATVLGITNDDIKRAKEAGTLADFLSKKFEAFNLAGDQLGQTFEGSLNRVKTALLSLGSASSLGVFEQLKGLFQDVSNLLVTIDKEAGTIQINPQFKAVADAFFQSIEKIVVGTREALKSLDFNSLVSSARVLGQSVKLSFDVIVGVVRGVAVSISALLSIIEALGKAISSIPLIGKIFDVGSLQSTIATLTKIFLAFKAIQTIIALMPGTVKAVRAELALWNVATEAARAGTEGITLSMALLGKSVAVVSLILKRTVIGFALFVAGALALKALEALFGGSKSLTDKLVGTEEDIKAKTAELKSLREEAFNFFNNLPTSITGSSAALKAQEGVISDLRKEFEKLNTERNLTLSATAAQGGVPTASLSGATSSAVKILMDAVLEAQTKTRDVELERLRNSEAIQGAAQQELSARLRLLQTMKEANASEANQSKIQEGIAASRKRIAESISLTNTPTFSGLVAPQQETIGIGNAVLRDVLKGATDEVKAREDIKRAVDNQVAAIENLRDAEAAQTTLEQININLLSRSTTGGPDASPATLKEAKSLSDLVARIPELQGQIRAASNAVANALAAANVPADQIASAQRSITELLPAMEAAEARIAELKSRQTEEATKNNTVTRATRDLLIEEANTLQQTEAQNLADFLSSLGVGEAAGKQILQDTRSLEEIQNRLIDLQEKAAKLNISKLAVEREANVVANAKLAIAFEQFNFEQGQQNLVDKVALESQVSAFQNIRADAATKEFRAAQSVTNELRLQVDLARQKRAADIFAVGSAVASKRAEVSGLNRDITGSPSTSPSQTPQRTNAFREASQTDQTALITQAETAQLALNALIQQEGLLRDANVTKTDSETTAINAAAEAENRARIISDDGGATFGEKLQLAAEDLRTSLPNTFQQIFNTLSNIVSGFSSFASDAIVDAFDPTKKVDLKARFAAFLQDVARQIISELVKIAVVKAVLGLSSLLGPSTTQSVPSYAYHSGGSVRRGPTRHVRGYDSGGVATGPSLPHLRPPGIDRRDTIPAWLSLGEFVQPVHRVVQYGADLMEAFRRGQIDPAEARSLMPSSRVRRSIRRTTSPSAIRSYAEGGAVAAAARASQTLRPASPAITIVPALVANDATIDQLFRGGGTAANRWLAEQGYVRQ